MSVTYFVSPDGDDHNPGTQERPFASLHHAYAHIRSHSESSNGETIVVQMRGGAYHFESPLEFKPARAAQSDQEIIFEAFGEETPVISGSQMLDCDWQPYRDGIMMCELPAVKMGDLDFSQLFVNGKRQIRARYPNYDSSDLKHYSGHIRPAGKIDDSVVSPDPDLNEDMSFSSGAPRGIRFDPTTFTQKRWARPQEAMVHIFQAYYWGNLQWQIKDIDWDAQLIWFGHGGHQMGAKWSGSPCEVNQGSYFYIENVFEELDAPGEWYLDRDAGILYFIPPADLDLASATIEAPVLQQLVRFVGDQTDPVRHITLRGLQFTQTVATYMEEYAIPSLSDWSIHRGGAIFMQGARDCRIEDCFFDAVGGNAVFMNNYNRGNVVSGCKFTETGDSAICFVGSLETTVGTQRNFPYECEAVNNLIHDCGVFGKQIAGVYISRAKRIRAAHNEIYKMPRAGICIGDGTWGGHLIEYNYIYDTCQQTGDHGPFNAWGRDKYWCLVQSHTEYTAERSHFAGHVLIDAMEPVVLRYNFFKESSGWGLDLDDGASNYEIYNNLCVGVSMKLREGAYRTIYNNVWINGANSPCFHVGNEDNHDRYFRNITVMSIANLSPEHDLNFEMGASYGEVYTLIAPPARGPWLEELDYNLFYSDLGQFVARVKERGHGPDWRYSLNEGTKYSLTEWQALGYDTHSLFADPIFVDAANGDYRVRPESPALKLGFENFDISSAGLLPEFPAKWLA